MYPREIRALRDEFNKAAQEILKTDITVLPALVEGRTLTADTVRHIYNRLCESTKVLVLFEIAALLAELNERDARKSKPYMEVVGDGPDSCKVK